MMRLRTDAPYPAPPGAAASLHAVQCDACGDAVAVRDATDLPRDWSAGLRSLADQRVQHRCPACSWRADAVISPHLKRRI